MASNYPTFNYKNFNYVPEIILCGNIFCDLFFLQ